jgi:hypothetical protein
VEWIRVGRSCSARLGSESNCSVAKNNECGVLNVTQAGATFTASRMALADSSLATAQHRVRDRLHLAASFLP